MNSVRGLSKSLSDRCTVLRTVCGPCAVCRVRCEPMHLVDLMLTCAKCCEIHGVDLSHEWPTETPQTIKGEQKPLF